MVRLGRGREESGVFVGHDRGSEDGLTLTHTGSIILHRVSRNNMHNWGRGSGGLFRPLELKAHLQSHIELYVSNLKTLHQHLEPWNTGAPPFTSKELRKLVMDAELPLFLTDHQPHCPFNKHRLFQWASHRRNSDWTEIPSPCSLSAGPEIQKTHCQNS